MSKEVLGTIYTEVSEDFQRGIYPIARTIKAEKHDLAIVEKLRGKNVEVKQIGNMDEDMETFSNPQCGRVYDNGGLSPTLSTMQGGQREPKIIVAMRGRNPDNPSDRTVGISTEQRLEPNSQGICNTLTSAQKDNMVMEKKAIYICNPDRVDIRETDTYRIRKLTPLECWRLMNFSDEDFQKAEEVNSNSQLYKQAGNSIVKNVLVAILGQMIPGKENVYKEI